MTEMVHEEILSEISETSTTAGVESGVELTGGDDATTRRPRWQKTR